MVDNSIQAFLALVRAGLWGKEARLSQYTNIDFNEVYQLSVEQSVTGLVLAGLEHSDVKPPQELMLQWIGEVQLIEQRNKVINSFVAELIERLRKDDIYALLVKGQGVAQCYERPLWRTSGDIDLLLDDDNYEKAKALLIPLADEVQGEEIRKKHQAIIIKGFDVELHGRMPFALSRRADSVVDDVIRDSLNGDGVRIWKINGVEIPLPRPDNDVVIVFTHFLHHFFIGGVGLRQICDWCRLLWTYRESLDRGLLESRIRKMGLMSEWKAFGAFVVDYLGMPSEAMPLFNENDNQNHNLHRKAELIMDYVLEVGNFGHNRDMSYYATKPYLIRKTISLGRRCGDLLHHVTIFPGDSLKFFPRIMINGLRSVLRGE